MTRLSITKFLSQRCGLLYDQFMLAKVDHRWHVFIAIGDKLLDRNLGESCFKWIDLPDLVATFVDFLPSPKDLEAAALTKDPEPPDEKFEEVA